MVNSTFNLLTSSSTFYYINDLIFIEIRIKEGMLIKYLIDMDWSGLKRLNDCDSARMNNMWCQQDHFFSAEFN